MSYLGNHGVGLFRAIDINQLNLNASGFLGDFNKARSNGFLSLAAGQGFNPYYNAAISGSQQLSVLTQLPNIPGFCGPGCLDYPLLLPTSFTKVSPGRLPPIFKRRILLRIRRARTDHQHPEHLSESLHYGSGLAYERFVLGLQRWNYRGAAAVQQRPRTSRRTIPTVKC